MIIICHHDNKVSEIIAEESIEIASDKLSIIECLLDIASRFPNEILAWCHTDLQNYVDVQAIKGLFHHNQMMFSYHVSHGNYMNDAIGYVEESIFIKVNKSVRFPTWQMSSDVGAIPARLLDASRHSININDNFDYFLNSFAKRNMSSGLFCYSEPLLLVGNAKLKIFKKERTGELFRFVKQHYKARWTFLLLLNLALYEKRFPLGAFLKSLFFRKRNLNINSHDFIVANLTPDKVQKESFDVLIPTIGRKRYLYDVLKDLQIQTLLPQKVIIVEQNPVADSKSELDYLTNQRWPFQIKHIFTHQSGACNARNLALNEVGSDWVFFADDDIRFDSDFLEMAVHNLKTLGFEAGSFSCLQKNQAQNYKNIFQCPYFGTSCSIVRADKLTDSKFSMGYEFGFAEDADFGMQIRYKGCDILYLPTPEIIHLKAPVGGFRLKPKLAWHGEKIQPKPSPTVMLFMLEYYTKQQLKSYQTSLFFKFYSRQPIKNPIRYFRNFKKQWTESVFWANELAKIK